MVLSDTTSMPALFAKHPSWHGQIDADPVLAEATRRRLFDRAVSDKALVAGYHFPFPAVGAIVPGPRRLYLRACCIIMGDVNGNGHRPPTSVAVFGALFLSTKFAPFDHHRAQQSS
jgi:hypothetical protein